MAFNTADPRDPQNAFDEDGEPLEQGHHPIFGDVRVRRAMQLAIDVDTLIEASLLGFGTPVVANVPPYSWAFDPDLEAVDYDPKAAERLLEEAGWKDVNRDGMRECRECLYAPEGYSLAFDLMVMEGEGRPLAANFINRQLGRVGVYANWRVMDSSSVLGEARQQRYDAYLGGWNQPFYADPDQTTIFTRAGDVIGLGNNSGSYFNETVDDLMTQAREVANCEVSTRAALYGEIQNVLQEDQPYVWLYAANDMIAADGDVMGFDPLPGRPFWNMRNWIVVR